MARITSTLDSGYPNTISKNVHLAKMYIWSHLFVLRSLNVEALKSGTVFRKSINHIDPDFASDPPTIFSTMSLIFKNQRFCSNVNRIFKKILSVSQYSTNTIIDPSFELTADQRQLQEMAYQFGLNEFRPNMRDWDEQEHFPRETLKQGAELGFGGLYVSMEDGGTGLSRLESSLVIEALSQSCVSTTAMLSLHNMCAYIISKFGSDAIKRKFLPDLVAFDKMASYCLTEPGAGSDSASLKTTAKRKDDHYIINGSKAFISGAGESDVYVVFCRTGGPGSRGISSILIEKGAKGLSFGKKERKLGWNCQPTRSVIMEDCIVPAENLIGQEGRGFKHAMDGMNMGRISMSSGSLGAAQRALEETIKYTGDRQQFQQPIINFQNTQFQLANLASELLAARLVVRSAARRMDAEDCPDDESEIAFSNFPIPSFAAVGKLVATEKAYFIIDACLQLFGGYGYLRDFPLQQLLRDSRVHRIIGGTNEIMKLLIARDFVKNFL